MQKCVILVDLVKSFPRSVFHEYSFAKIGVDTVENEPFEVWPACLPQTPPLDRMNSHAFPSRDQYGAVYLDVDLPKAVGAMIDFCV